jgi:wobble nucleotide-excising tRNase
VDIDEAEKLKELIVQPMVDAIRSEIKPIADQVTNHNQRIKTLEDNQKRALAGFAVYSTGLSLLVGSAWGWIKSKIHL